MEEARRKRMFVSRNSKGKCEMLHKLRVDSCTFVMSLKITTVEKCAGKGKLKRLADKSRKSSRGSSNEHYAARGFGGNPGNAPVKINREKLSRRKIPAEMLRNIQLTRRN